jgi:hypothetical protein
MLKTLHPPHASSLKGSKELPSNADRLLSPFWPEIKRDGGFMSTAPIAPAIAEEFRYG